MTAGILAKVRPGGFRVDANRLHMGANPGEERLSGGPGDDLEDVVYLPARSTSGQAGPLNGLAGGWGRRGMEVGTMR